MLLPRSAEPPSEAATRPDEEYQATGNRKVLLVEDNPDVRLLVSKLLESLGYQVTEVASALEADAMEHVKFDLLVCDVMLPGNRKGPDIARKFRTQQPDLAVLYMSGYQQGILTPKGIAPGPVSFIHKPFTKEDFAAQLTKLRKTP